MNKKIGGLTLALAAIASMAASPARAERIEVTFTGTLTTATRDFYCGACTTGDTSVTPLGPLTLSSSWIFDIGEASGLGPTSVSSLESTDADGRPTHVDLAFQLIGNGSLPVSSTGGNVPASQLAWANVVAPAGPASELMDVARYRMLTTDLGGAGAPAGNEIWGLSRQQVWTSTEGLSIYTLAQVSQWAPFAVTAANLGESFTADQFIDRLRHDFWCQGCSNVLSYGVSAANSAGVTTYTYSGPVTSFSVRVLAASAVPEPATYALMLAGVAVIGLAARRRKTV
ncbi:PEPxxWA-CTERM sorting domain-containing protein [Mitsuaria sp. 7]|uniref:PEPxxWA-CTERM sorting domain-containing protein n=1 Tax=Mitsuaria sp. 7 TaxID=1658665 RepID=UPI0007DE1C11|nr:PEPxxWA-CTERM sorting domain-containing protein [Mitsuaria sp. 7]ANH69563.1 hypothetical protein ABE85_21860 [Mitsuaria sp. 7]